MILLDTNVLSALMLEQPDVTVSRWLNRQPHTSIWTSSVTIFELQSGLNIMQPGRRRSQRIDALKRVLTEIIELRVAIFDNLAAELAAETFAARQKRGRSIELRDTMIAGIVLASHATLATRNVKHFEDIASSVINPWEA